MLIAFFSYKMCEHMTLQVINLYHGYVQTCCQSFSKTDTNQQRAHKSRSSGKSNRRKLFSLYTSFIQRMVYYRYYILLMCATRQFGNNTTICLMNSLGSRNVREQYTILDNCSTSVITRRFYSEDNHEYILYE